MKLPKLYRKVWIEWEWLTDELRGGEHVQNSGHDYFQVYRAKDSNNNWFWKLVGDDVPQYWQDSCDDEGVVSCVVKRNPDAADYFYPVQRLTIKEKEEQKTCRYEPRPRFKFKKTTKLVRNINN